MDDSPLLRLAPELRNLIYTFVLTSQYAVTLHDGATQPGLTKTCVQIRRESLPMYFSTTRLNAHFVSSIDPLLHFWQSLGTDMVLRMNELCIWDIHDLVGKFLGEESSQRLLGSQPGDGTSYVLRPIGAYVLNNGNDPPLSSALRHIVLALARINLTIQRFCLIGADGQKVQDMSEYAIVPHVTPADATDAEILTLQMGLNDVTRCQLLERQHRGQQVVRLQKGERTVIMFLSESFGLKSMFQDRLPEFTDEDWTELELLP